MHSGDYEKAVQAKGNVKKFDFIHMIQVNISTLPSPGSVAVSVCV